MSMTIEEMAKELGVSKSTVSRALSGKGRISEETRLRIQEYAWSNSKTQRKTEETAIHATQRETRCRNLGVVLPSDAYGTSIPFFQECLLGICETANLLKYNVLITTASVNDISEIKKLVENGKVDGMILARSIDEDKILKYLVETGVPTGLIGECEYDEVLQIDTDGKAAAEELTGMLISKGYRRFAFIVGNTAYRVNRLRRDGFLHALEIHGISVETQHIYSGVVNMGVIDNLITDMIASRTECVVCGDDVICTTVMSRLQVEGYRIPKDIAIVSLYNSSNLECFSPAVTAVNISAKRLGNTMAKQMIQYLESGDVQIWKHPEKMILDYEILFRKSTGKG